MAKNMDNFAQKIDITIYDKDFSLYLAIMVDILKIMYYYISL